MNNHVVLLSGPTNEPLIEPGERDYKTRAHIQCAAYVAEQRHKLGDEPKLAMLTTKKVNGRWTTVCWYQKGDRESFAYAQKALRNPPKQWTGIGLGYMRDMQTWMDETVRDLGITLAEFQSGRY